MDAFDKIHELGVVHNDVRPDNILISQPDCSVWVIDFECAGVGDESSFKLEREVVTNMMERLKRGEQIS